MTGNNEKLQLIIDEMIAVAQDADKVTKEILTLSDWQGIYSNLEIVRYLAMDAMKIVRRRIKSAGSAAATEQPQ